MTTFDRDTSVERLGPDEFGATISPDWNVVRGPNGGYVAALLLRAFVERVADPGRPPRSIAIQFVIPPPPGSVTIRTSVEKSGRSATMLTERMIGNDGKTLATAQATFSAPWPSPEYQDVVMPEVEPPEKLDTMPFARDRPAPTFFRHYDRRLALGHLPFSGAEHAITGGWIRLVEPRTPDAIFLAAASDAWPPAVFARSTSRLLALTTDLTVYFRTADIGLGPEDFVLAEFRSTVAREGFLEEDGLLWSPDGRILAQSRQLALGAPAPED